MCNATVLKKKKMSLKGKVPRKRFVVYMVKRNILHLTNPFKTSVKSVVKIFFGLNKRKVSY